MDKKAYFVSSYGDIPEEFYDVGEVEGFLDTDNNVIAWWSANDARWRGEYMQPLLKAFGIEVEDGSDEQTLFFLRHVLESQ